MATIYDCSVESDLLTGMRLARGAIGRGELVVIPTDTVYGVAADAFSPAAVQRLLDAKGRGRQSPPPVLVPGIPTLAALAESVPTEVTALVEAFWPGGLTIVLPAAPSLVWDLGETRGTVALRMPQDRIALELLSETGPLAVSSANLTGRPAGRTAAEAEAMLGDAVSVYLDGGEAGKSYEHIDGQDSSSTIVDATALAAGVGKLRILRHGVITDEQLRAVVGDALEGGPDTLVDDEQSVRGAVIDEAVNDEPNGDTAATEESVSEESVSEESATEQSAPEQTVSEESVPGQSASEEPAPVEADAAPAETVAVDAAAADEAEGGSAPETPAGPQP